MTAPLGDKRLEAAAQIANSAQYFDDIITARSVAKNHPDRAAKMLSTAIRETHAAELAEALEALMPAAKDGTTCSEWHLVEQAEAALAKFQEIANAR